jgi:hypothetical protein
LHWSDYLVLGLLIGGYLAYYIRQKRKSQRRSRPGAFRPLSRKEQVASRLLQAQGYTVDEHHRVVPVVYSVEDKERRFVHEGGFMASYRGKNYLVKIKRRSAAPPSSAAMRRELLLDYLLFQPAGILLFDEERERFQLIHFSPGEVSVKENRLLQLGLLLLIAVGVAFLYRLLFAGGN